MIELILVLLFTKHFIIDFPLQTPYQWQNKGNYGHAGGLLHSGLHGATTFLILSFFTPLAIVFGIVDFLMHYHIDYFKVKLTKNYRLTAENPRFWTLLGLDQYLHAMTYLAMVAFL
jgi:hypothetical protein